MVEVRPMSVPKNWIPSKKGRPRISGDQSVSHEENTKMEMSAPTTSLAEILGRLATVAEKWLENAGGSHEANKPSAEPKYLTPEEVAAILRVHVQTVLKWCRQGRLGASKHGGNEVNGKGGKYLILREAVDAYLRKQTLIHGERRRSVK